jgi:hypothetical protein
MLFKVENSTTGRFTHCGVLEFVADEGMVYLPHWVRAPPPPPPLRRRSAGPLAPLLPRPRSRSRLSPFPPVLPRR